MKHRIFLLILTVFLISFFPTGTEAKEPFNEKEWKEATAGLEYFRKPPKKETPVKENPTYDFSFLRFLQMPPWVLYSLIILILLGVIFMIVRDMEWHKPISPAVEKNAQELNPDESLFKSDLDRYIEEAIHKKEYKLALRLYYLKILKELSLKKLLVLKKENTNRDYLMQLYQTAAFGNFKELTSTYERAWFGTEQVEELDFSTFKQNGDRLLSNL